MIVTIRPKNGNPIKKKFSDPKQAIEWINSTTAELAAQQSVQADTRHAPDGEDVLDGEGILPEPPRQ